MSEIIKIIKNVSGSVKQVINRDLNNKEQEEWKTKGSSCTEGGAD